MTTPIEPNPPRWTPSTDPTSIVVPGLDTNAPINDQVDQIEQLITIKLQNIDANFSRIQHLMSTRLLPAVKRYALGTEPVREAAKFWTSFYEQAAQVHIPTFGDDEYSDTFATPDEQTQPSIAASTSVASVSYCEEPGDLDLDASAVTPSRSASEAAGIVTSYDVTASESSFMPANAVSSTPARPGHASDRTVDDQPSWSASLESPMVRLKSELQRFAREEQEEEAEASVHQDTSSAYTDSIMYEEEDTVQQIPPVIRTQDTIKTEKEKDGAVGLESRSKFQPSNIPLSALPTPRANATNAHVSPLKVKPKTPIAIPKNIQAFLPAKLENEPVFPSPRRPRYERTPRKPAAASASTSTSASASASSSVLDVPSLTQQHGSDSNPEPNFPAFNDSFDDSIDLMQGMSPPRTLAFARAPRSSVGLGLLPPLGRTPGKDLPTLGRTPGKQAADRIRRDLLGDMQSQFGFVNSAASNKMRTPAFGYNIANTVKDDTMSTIPTPPSLSRYTRHAYPSWTDSDTDTSLATMMRRLGLEPDSSYRMDSTSHSRTSSQTSDVGSGKLAPPVRKEELHTPEHSEVAIVDPHQDDQSSIQLGPHSDLHANMDSDSDSDSLSDEPVHSNQPSTAFLMASSREVDPDDSFGSSNSNHSNDSLDEDEFEDGDEVAVHPFARVLAENGEEGDGLDDSFDSEVGYDEGGAMGDDDDASETVFGIPPAQRRQQRREHGQLRMLGEDLLQDTIGIGKQLEKVGRVEESPTPYGRN